MKSLPHSKTYYVSITKTNLFILCKKIRSSFFWDVSSVDWQLPTFRNNLSVPSLRVMYLIPNFPMHVTSSNQLTFFDSLPIVKLMNRTSSSVICPRDQQNLTCYITSQFDVDLNLRYGLSGLCHQRNITGVLTNPQPDQEGNKLGSMSGTRALSTTSRRELSSRFFFPARQGAEGN